VLARVETAVVTVDPDLRVRTANPAAEALLRRGDGLGLREGRVRARGARDDRALAEAARRAAAAARGGAAGLPVAPGDALLPVERGGGDDGPRPYRLGVFALPPAGDAAREAAGAPVLLLVDDPGRDGAGPAPSDEDLFARAFALTPAEARLAARLAAGASLTEAAEALGVTRNTARAQLRAVFDKADVHSQAGLVRLLHGARGLRLSPR
jgi:DNA-binding CsgD family transcriptional regulator